MSQHDAHTTDVGLSIDLSATFGRRRALQMQFAVGVSHRPILARRHGEQVRLTARRRRPDRQPLRMSV